MVEHEVALSFTVHLGGDTRADIESALHKLAEERGWRARSVVVSHIPEGPGIHGTRDGRYVVTMHLIVETGESHGATLSISLPSAATCSSSSCLAGSPMVGSTFTTSANCFRAPAKSRRPIEMRPV